MKHHQLKLQDQYWDAIDTGVKTFDVRINDRDFRVGDIVLFLRYDNAGLEIVRPPQLIRKEIGYILAGGDFGISREYVVLQLKSPSEPQAEVEVIINPIVRSGYHARILFKGGRYDVTIAKENSGKFWQSNFGSVAMAMAGIGTILEQADPNARYVAMSIASLAPPEVVIKPDEYNSRPG